MNAERITAPLVKKIIDDHIQKHELKLDVKIHDTFHAVFGEMGKGGLCACAKEQEDAMKAIKERMDKYESNISRIVWMIGGTLIAAVLNLILKVV